MPYASTSMRNAAAEKPSFPTIPLENWTGYRFIPSRFPPVDLYRRVALAKDWQSIFELDNLTNPRLRQRQEFGSTDAQVSEHALQNWNHAPSAYPNPMGTVFTRPPQGALEIVDSIPAALAISIRKREEFLAMTDHPPTQIIVRLLATPVNGVFADGRSFGPIAPEDKWWCIGEEHKNAGSAGIFYKPALFPHGNVLVVFDGSVLTATVQGRHFGYNWDGSKIDAVYDSAGPNNPAESLVDLDRLFSGKLADLT